MRLIQSFHTELIEPLKQKASAWWALMGVSASINLLALAPSIYMMQVYDRVMVSQSQSTLWVLTALVIALFGLSAALEHLRSQTLIRIGNAWDVQFSPRLFQAAVDHGVTNVFVGAPAQAIRDFATVRQFVTSQGVLAALDAPWIVIYLAVLFMFHFWFGIFGLACILISVLLAVLNSYFSDESLIKANTYQLQSAKVADSALMNVESIAAMGMRSDLERHWKAFQTQFLINQTQASDRVSLWGTLSKSFRMMVQSAVLGLGAWLSLKGELSGGLMIAGSILLGKALAPLDLLVNASKMFSSAAAAGQRLSDLLNAAPAPISGVTLPEPQPELRLHNVHCMAPGAQKHWVLSGVNMLIPAGSALGVIGPSGGGKSSLVKLMAGIWKPTEGRVFLGGADLQHYQRQQLGPLTGYLSQHVELFEGTIAQNISRFTECEDSEITQAAMAAGVHDLIGQFPQGYSTLIGPQGQGLSGGMRQRIGLARALFKNPRLLLLDEPNSNLDEAGEWALLRAIQSQRQKGNTVVLVTHKRSVLRACNLLLVMERGQIKHFGPTEEVLKLMLDKQPPLQSVSNARTS